MKEDLGAGYAISQVVLSHRREVTLYAYPRS